MCQWCKQTPAGQAAAAELAEAEKALTGHGADAHGLPTGAQAFFQRHGARRDAGGRPGGPLYTGSRAAALDRFNAAKQAVRTVHDEFVMNGLREAIRAGEPVFTHADPAEKD